MKIAIKPVEIFLPGRGLVIATHVEVACTQLVLGVGAQARYELQRVDLKSPPDAPKYEPLTSGNTALTPEQYALWGTDDAFFANAIVVNAGLAPA